MKWFTLHDRDIIHVLEANAVDRQVRNAPPETIAARSFATNMASVLRRNASLLDSIANWNPIQRSAARYAYLSDCAIEALSLCADKCLDNHWRRG